MAVFAALCGFTVAQAPPSVVNYQGRVTRANGQPLPDGTVKVEVNIYDSPSAGTLLWDSGEKTVNVRGGVFALALQGNGATTPALGPATFASGFTWFEVVVWDGNTRRILSPRQLLAGVPWSLWASTVSDGAITNAKLAADPLSLAKVTNHKMGISGGNLLDIDVPVLVRHSLGIQVSETNAPLHIRNFSDAANRRFLQIDDLNAGGSGGSLIVLDGTAGRSLTIANYWSGIHLATSQAGVPSPRLTVAPTGNVGINTTEPESLLHVNGNQKINGTLRFQFDGSTWADVYANAGQFRIDAQAQIVIGSPNLPGSQVVIGTPGAPNGMYVHGIIDAGGYVNHSSGRFKTHIRPLESALERLLKVKGVEFKWKPEMGGKKDIGVIAEDVAEVFPEIVSRDRKTGAVSGVDYGHLSAVSIEAIRELKNENDRLKGRVKTLESRLAAIERRLEGRP